MHEIHADKIDYFFLAAVLFFVAAFLCFFACVFHEIIRESE